MNSTLNQSELNESAKETKSAENVKHRQWWQISIAIAAVPLAIIGLECLFSAAGIGQGEIVKPDTELGCRHIPNKSVTWRLEGYSRGKLNSLGMRDIEHPLQKATGTTRIAFLGDSYTEGLQVQREKVFANRLPEILGKATKSSIESLNFGCSSYSTAQELLQFEREVAPYKPDIVVLLYTPGDTLENVVSPAKRASAEARPYFYLDQNQNLKQDNGLLTYNRKKLESDSVREFLRANSTIFGAYTQNRLSMTMSDKVFFRVDRFINQAGTKVGDFLQKLKGRSPEREAANGLLPPDFAEPKAVPVSTALVERLNSEVIANGGKLVVMAFPDIGGGNLLYAQTRAALERSARQTGYGYLDLSLPFKKDSNPNNLFLQVHFSALGHELSAHQLADYLIESKMLESKPVESRSLKAMSLKAKQLESK